MIISIPWFAYVDWVTRHTLALVIGTLGLVVSLTACTSPEPIDSRTSSPTATGRAPSPTMSPSAPPSPTLTPTPDSAPSATTDEGLALCVEMTTPYFAGAGTDALTFHLDAAQVGTRIDGTVGVHIPVTDLTPGLVGTESSATCILSADLTTVQGRGAQDPMTEAEIAELMSGANPGGL